MKMAAGQGAAAQRPALLTHSTVIVSVWLPNTCLTYANTLIRQQTRLARLGFFKSQVCCYVASAPKLP